MKFNSQICTTKFQSVHLLELGLKKETADMVWTHAYYGTWVATASENPLYEEGESIPAWSLHRLIEMVAGGSEEQMIFLPNPYDELIEEIAGAFYENFKELIEYVKELL